MAVVTGHSTKDHIDVSDSNKFIRSCAVPTEKQSKNTPFQLKAKKDNRKNPQYGSFTRVLIASNKSFI